MEFKGHTKGENMKLLQEIFNLKMILREMYAQNGPNSSDYITLSIKLNVLEKKYMEEKLQMFKDELGDTWRQQETKHPNRFEKIQKRDRSANKHQKSLIWHVLVNR